MKSYWMLLPTLAILVAACANQSPSRAASRAPVFIGMTAAQGQKIIDSVYWNMAVRPDTVMNQNGMLRVVLPGTALGHRVSFEGKGCHVDGPPFGAIRAVARHAWSARDSSVRGDTVHVVLSLVSDTLQTGSWPIHRTKSCGGTLDAPVDVTRLQ